MHAKPRRCAGLAMALLAAFACGRGRPNLVLISVDTLRPDRLGFDGHFRDTSPAMDQLAREGVVFENAYSESGWTLPSMATILTGRPPREHGATSYDRSVDPRLPTLASILKERGYETRAYVSHVLLRQEFGLARGFDHYDTSVLSLGDPHEVAGAQPLTDAAIRDLQQRPIREPFFLWLHYFDPHFVYLRHPRTARWGSKPIDLYDGEIAYTDREVSRLLAYLRDEGLYEDAVVALTSDHGETFEERAGRFHDTLHEEVVRVPLVIRAPFLQPRVERSALSQVDVFASLLDALGVPLPEGSAGRSALGAGGAAGGSNDRPLVFERELPLPFRQRAIRQGSHKLIAVDLLPLEIAEIPEGHAGSEYAIRPGLYLYDLSRDPGEQRNLYREGHPVAGRLREQLLAHFDEPADAPHRVEHDPDVLRQLRALGYVD